MRAHRADGGLASHTARMRLRSYTWLHASLPSAGAEVHASGSYTYTPYMLSPHRPIAAAASPP